MGEAKRRAAARKLEHATVDQRLRRLGIDTAKFGFYDQPAFLAEERHNGEFLDQYAIWVKSRPRTAEYDERVRDIVPRLAELLADLFERRNMHRSCVHASSMMQRILDRLGVWSYGLKGSMIMEVECEDLWRGQCMCDTSDFAGAELGHAWVVAPPFEILDPTIRLQNPPGDAMNRFTPPIVVVEGASLIRPTIDDVIGAELRELYAQSEGRTDEQLHHRLIPHLKEFGRNFPSREVKIEELTLRYVPAGVRISDVVLEEINGAGDQLTGAQVWNDYVAPTFSKYIVLGGV
ncbi:hypothetical protein [Pararhodobacter sp. SW119]|uniref:hypothetical protein n=1 Tax=Pararhodobacter sp. SW119 TaxID=2780075 RepID=UPI001ADFCBB5|nr:hypothetical protein [Pararhodobacter sp. SW119]